MAEPRPLSVQGSHSWAEAQQPAFMRGFRMAMQLVAEEAEERGEPVPPAAQEALSGAVLRKENEGK